jgi:hypothetical protein
MRMDVYYDSEFVDTGRTIDPISIGFVREDGEELYRVFKHEDTIRAAIHHPWLRENVVSSLPVSISEQETWIWDTGHPDFECVKSTPEIREDVEKFLYEAAIKGDLTLWAWYAAYDHVLLAQIWGKMLDLPSWMPMNTCDLRQEHLRLGEPTLPRQKEGRHNALADARHNRVMHEALREIERSRMPGTQRGYCTCSNDAFMGGRVEPDCPLHGIV